MESARPSRLAALLVFLTPFLGLQTLEAQILYGSIVGTIKDASDAVIPDATVQITNVGTNSVRATATSEVGTYIFPDVQPGTYTLAVSKAGFSPVTVQNVTVTINNVIRTDATLRPGSATETITVSAALAALQTDRSDVRTDMTPAELVNLPTPPGRNYQQLFVTLPGFSSMGNINSIPTNPSRAFNFNVNGTSYNSNNIRVDGATSTNVGTGWLAAYVPSLEAIETVNVVTNSFDAEQGLAGGSAVNVQTKSGTNDLHGSAFNFFTGNQLKARPFFLPPTQQMPRMVYNQFGGTVGGPIKRNKLFYFVSYEAVRDRESASTFATVATKAMRDGDFSESSTPIYDPSTGTSAGANRIPFPNNVVPVSRQSSIVRKLITLTPMPNVAGAGLSNNYSTRGPWKQDRNTIDTKISWNPAQKLTLFARLGLLFFDATNSQTFGNELGGPTVYSVSSNPGHGWGANYGTTIAGTYTFSPRFVMDSYFGYDLFDTNSEQPRLDEKICLDQLGIPGTNGPRRSQGGWCRFVVPGFTTLGHSNDLMPYYKHNPQYQLVSNFGWTKGTHGVRFGVDLYKQDMNDFQPMVRGTPVSVSQEAGGFDFAGGQTGLAGGASPNNYNTFASFVLGLPRMISKINWPGGDATVRSWAYSFYVRDQWQVSRKLTFTYGVRWEYFPMPTRADRGLEFYDPATNKVKICGVGFVPRDCGVEVSKKRFAPRVGLVYRAGNKFVIRAGYGITNDPLAVIEAMRAIYPVQIPLTIMAPNSFQPAGRLENGIPPIAVPSLGDGLIDIPGDVVAPSIPQKDRRGYVQSWNFTVQRELKYGFVGQAGYVATRQTRQLGIVDINAGYVIGAGVAGQPLYQKYGRTASTTMLFQPVGTGQYNSLQSSLERRFSRGLQVAVHYTWSKAISVADNSDSNPRIMAPQFFDLNRAVTNYDRTHALHITNVYELPFGRGKRWANQPGFLSYLLGHWQVNNLLSFISGRPFSVSSSSASLNMPQNTQRADQVKSTVAKIGGVGPGQSFFDPLAFVPVTQPRFGTAGYNSLRGPGIVNWDFGLFRFIPVGEHLRLEFRAEAFNTSNTPHFAQPGANVSNLSLNPDGSVRALNGFTQVTATSNGAREGIDERQFRLALRLSF
jgi:hypothetical protein